ncbi:MAG: ABC transporter substrate-binding protein [Methylobacteriaceae bacterium]|nr:ABC transporter substrate-binding protein [Methylobacteriaceae bacterium]
MSQLTPNRRRVLFSAALGVTVIALAKPAAAEQAPIKVGLLMTYQGPTAILARYADRGARLAIEEANKTGGAQGRPIEIVGYDTEGKPDRAGVLFRRLAEEDKVSAVIGPDGIYVTLGMSSIPAQVKVISVASPGGYEYIEPKDRSYLVTGWAASGFSATLVLAYLKDKYKIKRIGILSPADTIGQKTTDEFVGTAKMLGLEVAKVVSQPASDRDLLPSLRQLASVTPKIDAVGIYGSGPFGTIAVNQTELAGLDVPIAYVGGNIIPELIKDIGPDVGKRFFVSSARVAAPATLPKTDPYYERIQKFVAAYTAKYNEAPTYPSAVGYDMALTVIDALKVVGPEPEKVREYIIGGQKGLVGVQGVTFNRTPKDGYGTDQTDNIVTTIENGKFVFKGYLGESFKNLGVTQETVHKLMREHHLLLD